MSSQAAAKRPYRHGSPFHRWLMLQIKRDSPVGDLARDAKTDFGYRGGWPFDAIDIDAYRQYLLRMGACDGALDALDDAWEEWAQSGPLGLH